MKRLPRISDDQYKGVEKLLSFCVYRYQIEVHDSLKTKWKEYIDFLAELQRKQSYTEEDKEMYNKIREKYYQHKLG
jgi:hypothetical protein